MAGLKPIKTKNTAAAEAEAAEEEEVEPLSPGARVFHTPQLNCCIISEIGCKTAVDAEVVKGGLKLTLLKHPRFCSKLVFDSKDATKPIGWVRTTVNIDDHVLVPDFDLNVDSPDKFIEDYKYNLTKTPMDFTKPLWELHILNIKTSQAKSIAIFRIHHSIGDGISLTSLLLACTRKTSDSEALPTLPVATKKPRMQIQTKGRPLGFLWQWFLRFLLVLKVLWNTLIDLVLFLATMLWLKDSDTPLKGTYGNEQHPRRFVHRMLNLDDIKMVKNATNATINDVVLGITQAGLSRYLNKSYGMAKGDDQENNIPKNLRLRGTLLVNLRPTSTIEGLAEMMEGNSKRQWSWGNSIGYILLPFHVGLKDDPLDYIRDAKATIDRKKQSLEGPATYASAKLVLKMIGLRVIARLTYNVLLNTTLSFSNVVGPVEEISFYGYPLTYLAPSVYGHPQALTVHFQSYVDKMILVLAVDENIISDPHVLCDYLEESLRFAKNAAIKKEIDNS